MAKAYVNAYVDGPNLYLVSRNQGRVLVERTRAEYVSWHRYQRLGASLLRSLRGSRMVASVKAAGDWVRVGWKDEQVRRAIIGAGEEGPLSGVESFEGDVDPIRLWLTESGAEIARPHRCYLDLEVDSDRTFVEMKRGEARVLTWSVVDGETGRKRCNVLEADDDAAEKAFLESLWRELGDFDQVACWSGSWGGEEAFDFLVLWNRSKELGIKVEPRRWLWVDQLVVFRRMNMHAAKSGNEKRSFKLDDIAQELLGKGKLKEPGIVPGKSLGAQTRQLWDAGGRWRALLVRYNVDDALRQYEIEQKTGYLALFDTLCEVCGVFGDTEGLNPTGQMDGFMLRLGHQRGYRFPTRKFGVEQGDKFKGAYVMKPKTHGIARDVHVLDFSSMYPSIIVAFNMGPDTVRDIPVNGPIPEGHSRAPTTGAGFDLQLESILVAGIRDMLRLRKYWSDKKAACVPGTPEWRHADRMSTAYKVAANSFYGVLGTIFSRFFNRKVAESITQTGVWLIQRTNAEAEKRGMRVVYTDTDGSYMQGTTSAQMIEFVDWCNRELYPSILGVQGCRELSMVKVAYEKAFDRIIFTAAKRYCARYLHYKGTAATADSEPEVKGLEYKRGDTGLLGYHLQAEVIDMLVGGLKLSKVPAPTEKLEDYHSAIARVRDHVLNDPLTLDEVMLSKSLSRGLKEYAVKRRKDGTVGTQPAHVVVAGMLKERGRLVDAGMRVEYVVKDAVSDPTGLIPAEDYAGECDRYHLWESVVFPPTRRLLEAAFPGHDWESWGKVRPTKERITKATKERDERAAAGQGDLFTLAVPAQIPMRRGA